MTLNTLLLLLTITPSLIIADELIKPIVSVDSVNDVGFARESLPQDATDIVSIQKKLNHIKAEKEAVLIELRNTLIIGRKAKRAIKVALQDRYPAVKDAMLDITDYIVCSQEFITAISTVIRHQIQCICDELISFDDIAYEMDENIRRKIDDVLNRTFPHLDEQINNIFNIFYVTHVNAYGCKVLLNALEKQEIIAREQLNRYMQL